MKITEKKKGNREVSGWIDPDYSREGLSTTISNHDLLDYVMPVWLKCDASGGVTVKVDLVNELTAFSKENSLKLFPLIGGDPDDVSKIIQDKCLSKAHIANLLKLAVDNSWIGVDIDYEFLAEEQKCAFTTFIKDISTVFRDNGKIISVDLHPKVRHDDPWSIGARAQDWRALSEYADILRVMCYDQCHPAYKYPDAGPISSYAWSEAVMTFAAGLIPKDKLVMGLPLYGCDWNLMNPSEARHLYFEQIMLLATETGSRVEFDLLAQVPYFDYLDPAGVKRQVWFEDRRSFEKKYSIVDKLDLRGISTWVFIMEDPAVWQFIRREQGAELQT